MGVFGISALGDSKILVCSGPWVHVMVVVVGLVPQMWTKNQKAKGNLSWLWTYYCRGLSVSLWSSGVVQIVHFLRKRARPKSSQLTLTLSAHRLASETASPPEHGQRPSQHPWPREGSRVEIPHPLSPVRHLLHSPFFLFPTCQSLLDSKRGTLFGISLQGQGPVCMVRWPPHRNWAASPGRINSTEWINPPPKLLSWARIPEFTTGGSRQELSAAPILRAILTLTCPGQPKWVPWPIPRGFQFHPHVKVPGICAFWTSKVMLIQSKAKKPLAELEHLTWVQVRTWLIELFSHF